MSESSRDVARVTNAARLLLGATVLTPLVLAPGFLFPYVTTRAVFFRVVVELATLSLAWLLARREPRPHPAADPFLMAMLAFVGIQVVASVAGVAPVRSLYGDLERMWGVWGWLHLLLFYVALRTILRPADWLRWFRACVIVSIAVAAYALWQSLHAALSGGANVAVASTIGNSGLAAAYFLLSLGIAALLATREERPALRRALAGAAALNGLALVLAQNRSSVLALAAGTLLAILLLRRGRRIVLAVAVVTAAVLAAGRALPSVRAHYPPVLQRLALTGTQESDAQRAAQLPVLAAGVREHPLLGVGPENFDYLWSTKSARGAEQVHDREHDAYLEALATSGLAGALAFVAMWTCAALALRRARRSGRIGAGEAAVAAGMLLAYSVYLLFWFVDLNSVMLWVALVGWLQTRASDEQPLALGEERAWRGPTRMIVGLVALLVAFAAYVHGVGPLQEARALVRVLRRTDSVEENLASLDAALASPAPQKSHALLIYVDYLSTLGPELAEARGDPYRAKILDAAFRRAFAELNRQTRLEPKSVRLATVRKRLSGLALAFYGQPGAGAAR